MENQSQTEAQPKPKNKWNKRVWMLLITFLGIIIVLVIISGGNSGNNQKEIKKEQPKETVQNNNVQQVIESTQKKIVEYKELASYEKSGKIWKNVVIPSGTSQEDLIAFAKELHKKDSKSYFHIFDDDAKFQEYMDWDINYGKVRDKDGKIKTIDQCSDITYCRTLVQQRKYPFPFPEEWGDKHEIAIINEMFDRGGLKWKLSSPLGIEISSL